MDRPCIGLTCDAADQRFQVSRSLCRAVSAAGAVPLLLPCGAEEASAYLEICQGIVLSGGDDPIMEPFGAETHPRATPVDPQRQDFELALLRGLDRRPDIPVLGVCLGMQMMSLHAGGLLDQYLPETIPTAADHFGHLEHRVRGELGDGQVHSHHRQAVRDPGGLRVIAKAHDGVIEAVRAEGRHFYLGVQWHPERTDSPALGAALFTALVQAACRERVS
jgi:putative glutamine amidotransferase